MKPKERQEKEEKMKAGEERMKEAAETLSTKLRQLRHVIRASCGEEPATDPGTPVVHRLVPKRR